MSRNGVRLCAREGSERRSVSRHGVRVCEGRVVVCEDAVLGRASRTRAISSIRSVRDAPAVRVGYPKELCEVRAAVLLVKIGLI